RWQRSGAPRRQALIAGAQGLTLLACGGQQAGPLPPPDADQIVDDYLKGAQTAFADNDLMELQRVVLGGSTPYEVDGQIITQLAAKGAHRERSYHRVGHPRVISPGGQGMVIEASIRVDNDTDVGSQGQRTVRFAPQTLVIHYTFLRLTAEAARLEQACMATSLATLSGSPGIPTPMATLDPQSSVDPVPKGPPPTPLVIPAPSSHVIGPGDLEPPPRMEGPCNMQAFPF
ncbi:MAG: hypothetical protein ACREQ5_23130, partial [Candidatus Dormibacteria bacterium]